MNMKTTKQKIQTKEEKKLEEILRDLEIELEKLEKNVTNKKAVTKKPIAKKTVAKKKTVTKKPIAKKTVAKKKTITKKPIAKKTLTKKPISKSKKK